ncbi:MAG: RdgB/HAM1 family non-canonical purine NTP pyrophosphatase [Thiomargarita sp.]|nr:RdgB/HAM1 family non-canonical purine NTP pyrophosphatase [Thiomargarita sp.]
MQQIVLASGNAGKLREFAQMLAAFHLDVVPQSQFNVPEVAETGLSFVENALIKARNAAQHTGLPAMSDDSGIEIDALQGAPGIYSARFAGAQATDAQNNALLLEKLTSVPDDKRTARYHCVIVYMRHAQDSMPIICQGTWEGRILHEAHGSNGFGYDPFFYVPTHDCTSAELTPEVKNNLSHRGQALRALQAVLAQ